MQANIAGEWRKIMTAANRSMDSFWMPFTGNRAFKQNPRLVERAQGMFYYTPDGCQILDMVAGLWCCNVGHGHPKVVKAIQQQAAKMDYAPHVNFAHSAAFEVAEQLTEIAPENMNHVFFTNSGLEAVDTALKIALAYQRERGMASKTRLIGRERGYHGVGFGGRFIRFVFRRICFIFIMNLVYIGVDQHALIFFYFHG